MTHPLQSIETVYHGATSNRGARIIATPSGAGLNVRETLKVNPAADGDIVEQHAQAAEQLRTRLEWVGPMVCGHSKRGLVWVFTSGPAI